MVQTLVTSIWHGGRIVKDCLAHNRVSRPWSAAYHFANQGLAPVLYSGVRVDNHSAVYIINFDIGIALLWQFPGFFSHRFPRVSTFNSYQSFFHYRHPILQVTDLRIFLPK